MEEYIQGENIFFEVIPLNKCQKKNNNLFFKK